MDGCHDPLAALAELELRFNGPIPVPLRRAALLGSPTVAERLAAEGQIAFFTALVRGQLAIIRVRRTDGSFYPSLLDDLALYRRQRRFWRARARRLADELARGGAPRP
jgi:hypothetical protein